MTALEPSVLVTSTSYRSGDGTTVPVHLARPAAEWPRPAVVLVYELLGMQEVPGGAPHMRDLAWRFARQGYVAAIPDLYAARGMQPQIVDGKVSGAPPDPIQQSDLQACVEWLRSLPSVDPEAVGAIGWCGGGRQTLLLAAAGIGLRAAASFYGRPVNLPHQPGISPIEVVPRIECPVFGAYGEDDHSIPADTARRFEAECLRSGAPCEMHIFADAGHAFMNDGRPTYVPDAAVQAWAAVLDFFARHLVTQAG